MQELLIQLRTMQLYSHSAHHLLARAPFLADHDFFGSVYEEMQSEYDGIAERIVGVVGEAPLDLAPIVLGAANKCASLPSINVKENSTFFKAQLELEHELCKLINAVIQAGVSEGTRQLLGDVCNRSEMRQYKIKRRTTG